MSDWFDEVFLIAIEEEEQEGFRFQSFSIQGDLVVPGQDNDETERGAADVWYRPVPAA